MGALDSFVVVDAHGCYYAGKRGDYVPDDDGEYVRVSPPHERWLKDYRLAVVYGTRRAAERVRSGRPDVAVVGGECEPVRTFFDWMRPIGPLNIYGCSPRHSGHGEHRAGRIYVPGKIFCDDCGFTEDGEPDFGGFFDPSVHRFGNWDSLG